MKTQTTVFLRNFAILLLWLWWLPPAGHGQTVSKCFNIEKINKLYASTFLEINNMLLNESWEIMANAGQTPFAFGKDTLMYDNFSQWKYELSVDRWWVSQYRKKGLAPVLLFQTSKNCYEAIENELQKNSATPPRVVEDSIQRLRIFEIRQGVDIIFPSRKSHQPYSIMVGNYAQIDSLIKAQLAEKEEYGKTIQEQQQFIQAAIEQIHPLRKTEDYAAAILILEHVMNQPFIEREELIIEHQEVSNLMIILKKEENQKNFNLHVQIADSAFVKENYATAKAHLLQAQQIDATSSVVLQKLKEIEKIESMFITRQDSIFNYVSYYKPVSNAIKTDIFNKLRKYFLSVDAGDVNFTYTLQTDTLGQNISSYQINTFLLRPAKLLEEAWASFLDTLIIFNPIPPVKIDYLYVNAATSFQNQSSWKTSVVKVSKGKRIKILPQYVPPTQQRTLANYFKNNSSLPNGKYTIEKREITHQDSLHTTLALKKVYTVGPEAMFYSMLFPGVGSIVATQGKKGWGIFSSAIVFAGVGTAGLLVANHLEKKGGTEPKTIAIIRYASYGSFAVTGVIHFSGIFVALKQGLTNLEKSRALKTKLKEKPVFIQDFPQHIEP